MTTRTRRRLFVLALLGLVTIPVEAVVLPVWRTPDEAAAARQWAAAQAPGQITGLTFDIRTYPYEFRRAIMAALTPEQRAAVWLVNFQRFLDEHPELTPPQRRVVELTLPLITPDLFSGAPADPAVQQQLAALYEVAAASLGASTARELFYRLGPDRTTGASPLPLTVRLATLLRRYTVVEAAPTPDCECAPATDIDCNLFDGHAYSCNGIDTCNLTASFPMCGPLWCDACVGMCEVNAATPAEGGGAARRR